MEWSPGKSIEIWEVLRGQHPRSEDALGAGGKKAFMAVTPPSTPVPVPLHALGRVTVPFTDEKTEALEGEQEQGAAGRG